MFAIVFTAREAEAFSAAIDFARGALTSASGVSLTFALDARDTVLLIVECLSAL